jgi:hypothetical protein
MASESIGVACEIIVALACEQRAVIQDWVTVHHPEDQGATVAIPDFVLTRQGSKERAYLQVTYAGSKPDSQKKLWRNLGELQELVTLGSSIPRVVAITFGSAYLNYIPHIYKVAWHGALFSYEVSPNLDSLAIELATKKGSFEERLEEARIALRGDKAVLGLSKRLALLLDTTVTSHPLWALHRKRVASVVAPQPGTGVSSVKRGIAKLLLGRPPEGLLKKPPSISADSERELLALGIIGNSINGLKLVDHEVVATVRSLGSDVCRNLIEEAPRKRLEEWLLVIWGAAEVRAAAAAWLNDWQSLSPALVYQHLRDAASKHPPARFVFISLFELIKGALGKRQAVGSEQLLRGIELREQLPSTAILYREILGRPVKKRDHETIRLGLQSVFSPGGKQGFTLLEDDIVRVAVALYESYLLQISEGQAKAAAETLLDEVMATYFNVKVVTYRHLDPVGCLVRWTLENYQIAYRIENLCSPFADPGACGERLDPRATATKVAIAKNTIINWQSVTEDGRDHKRKELCGRAAALRYRWDQRDKTYVHRMEKTKLILIADGSWRQDDFVSLYRAGWDTILNAFEIRKLNEEIE